MYKHQCGLVNRIAELYIINRRNVVVERLDGAASRLTGRLVDGLPLGLYSASVTANLDQFLAALAARSTIPEWGQDQAVPLFLQSPLQVLGASARKLSISKNWPLWPRRQKA